MKRKVAIIEPFGSHGSSHHFYLFGQAKGLIENGVKVSLYTNKNTENPNIQKLKFHQTYGDIFASSSNFLNGIRYLIGSTFSIFGMDGEDPFPSKNFEHDYIHIDSYNYGVIELCSELILHGIVEDLVIE